MYYFFVICFAAVMHIYHSFPLLASMKDDIFKQSIKI